MKRLLLCLVLGVALSNCVITPDEDTTAKYPSPLVLTDLKVTLAKASIFLGQTTTAVASGVDQFGNPISTGAVTYASNSAAATITQDGVITSVATGSVIISATTATKHAETLLTIAAPVALASMQITLPNAPVRVGQSVTATVAGKDEYGVAFPTNNVVWSSSSPGVATISQSGTVTGVAIGQTTLTATSQGITATLPVSVVSATPVVQSVTLAGERRVKVGDTYVYTPTITMSDGTTANLPVTYSISPVDFGTISASGVLTPLKSGTISVIATVNSSQFPTTVVGYDWSSGQVGTIYSANLSSDSAVTPAGPLTIFPPSLIVECSGLDQLQPTFNVYFSVTQALAPGLELRYGIDGNPLKTETWMFSSPAAVRLQYPGLFVADRVALARSLASGRLLKLILPQTSLGSLTATYRITGMAAAIAPVLAACGLN